MARQPNREKWLIFVDTNILLDFYRLGGESVSRQLDALERHKDSLILSDQVRMEFLKNRQKVILDSINQFKKPIKPSFPNLISEYQPSKMLKKHTDTAIKKHKLIVEKIGNILRDPIRNDHVFTRLNKIYDYDSPFNLNRSKKIRFEIRNKARKRFVLGYPPRKSSDTSIGDAVNWEWIVRCAKESTENHHVLLVSRDSDYGLTYGDDAILNDWLRREFKERVSRKRNAELTNRLTKALKVLDEAVAEEDIQEEESLIQSWRPIAKPDVERLRKAILNVTKDLENPNILELFARMEGLELPRGTAQEEDPEE